jgi:hypothetical protein
MKKEIIFLCLCASGIIPEAAYAPPSARSERLVVEERMKNLLEDGFSLEKAKTLEALKKQSQRLGIDKEELQIPEQELQMPEQGSEIEEEAPGIDEEELEIDTEGSGIDTAQFRDGSKVHPVKVEEE